MSHTNNALEVADPSDWLQSSIPKLAPVDDGRKSRKTAGKRKVEDTDFEDDIHEERAIASARNTRAQGRKRLDTTPKLASDLSVNSITPPLASSSPSINANADSSRPKTKREMLRELDIWDRSTGRSIANNSSDQGAVGSVMNKQFDGTAWSLSHSSEFQDLISKARKTNISPQKSPKHAIPPSESDADAADLRTRT
ncbi:MAG: hypothetical protein L6R37_001235 [Teloschistes peruensis]|nr:MAG: hypothetical protein L6R37_001235 [Teloschistes peruensis]